MNDTIVALATPLGASAIGVIRMSGPEAFAVAGRALKLFSGALAGEEPRALAYAALIEGGAELDRVVVASFRGPGSYTGEDTVEISCHGSPFLLQRALRRLVACGARPAERGEFTKRAFLNGKMDLAEAEGVAALIASDSDRSAQAALNQMKGLLSARLEEIYRLLLGMTASLLAYVDYPDDEIGEVSPEQLNETLALCREKLRRLIDTYSDGRRLREGVPTVIAGPPNAGKSSVMNRLAGYDRSIVTDVAGTTRDTVEESVTFGGVKWNLTDTAGLRDTDDRVEKMGVARARTALQRAELVLWVCDGSRPPEPWETAEYQALSGAKKIVLLNKSDLGRAADASAFPDAQVLSVSALTGEGFDELEALIAEMAPELPADGEMICDLRHYNCLCRAEEALARAQQNRGMTPDVLLSDAEEALAALGELTGRRVSEQVLEEIFSRFCVGK